jgi:hypothetical protein
MRRVSFIFFSLIKLIFGQLFSGQDIGNKNPDALPNAGVREAIEPTAMGNGEKVHYYEQCKVKKGSFKK